MFDIWLVYGSEYNDVMAIFPLNATGEAQANAYIAANGGLKVEGKIPLPFYATPSIPVNPS